MKQNLPILLTAASLSALSLQGGELDWNAYATNASSDPFHYTVIGNGTGANQWDVGGGYGSSITTGPVSITNTFNGDVLTDGFDFDVTIDMSGQTMNPLDTQPGGYLMDFPGVNPWMDGSSNDHSLGIRMNSSSGILPAGNADVSRADLGSGAATWADLTPETVVITLDHKGANGMKNVEFNLYEIELLFDDIDDNWDHETVIVTGLGTDGLTYEAALTALAPGSSASPDINGNVARGVDVQSDHGKNDAGIGVSFGSTNLDSVTVTYEMRRRTDIGSYSFGLGLGDVSFTSNPIPEPSVPILTLVAGGVLLMRRKRETTR